MNEVSQTLQQQGSPILLLAHLQREFPTLPAATYHIDNIVPEQLAIILHDGDLARFEAWRVALGLSAPVVRRWEGSAWVDAVGVTADVPVKLTGHGTADEIAAYVAAYTAVAA